MWKGGVRVIVLDQEYRMLMVKQHHEDRDIWMLPGGGIEDNESAWQAAIREVKEETGLNVTIDNMIWHVEEVSERGQRFVNYFIACLEDNSSSPVLGYDPEFGSDEQVLRDVRFLTKEEVQKLEHVYPDALREELWECIAGGTLKYDAYRNRKDNGFE